MIMYITFFNDLCMLKILQYLIHFPAVVGLKAANCNKDLYVDILMGWFPVR